MKLVMVSGHFDPLHEGHISYLRQAAKIEQGKILCIVSSDRQVIQKKGKVNIPEGTRLLIVTAVLRFLLSSWKIEDIRLNTWDTETTLVAEALRAVKPGIFFRGGDKTMDDMPPDEKKACDDLGIQILYAQLEYDVHGKEMRWEKS